MNILYIADSACFHTALWTKYFCESGKHNVYLFSDQEKYLNPVNYPESIVKFQSQGVAHKVLEWPVKRSIHVRHMSQLLSVFKYRREIDKIIKQCNIDIVHCHSLYYGYLVAGIKNKTVPVIFSPQGSDVIEFAQDSRFYARMARMAYDRAQVVTGDSLIKQTFGYRLGAKREHNYIIQYGVDQSLFYPKPSLVRQDLEIPENVPLFFSPRGLEDIYNQEIIIEALAKFKKKGNDFYCMFTFPSGSERQKKLQLLAEKLHVVDNLIWVGYVDYTQMPEYHNAADIVISVPNTDSSPKSVYEAMSCKKPVIVSKLPWASEFLTDKEDFLIVEEGSSESLLSGIEVLLQDKALREKLANSGYEKAVANYGYLPNMIKMEEIMEQVVNHHLGELHRSDADKQFSPNSTNK